MSRSASILAAVLLTAALMAAVSVVLSGGKRDSSEIGVRSGSSENVPAGSAELALPEEATAASERDPIRSNVANESEPFASPKHRAPEARSKPKELFVDGFGEANGFALEPGTHAGIAGVRVTAVEIDERGASHGPPYSTLTDFSGFYRFELPVSAEQAARGGAKYHLRLEFPGRMPAECLPTVRVDATTSINSYLAEGEPDDEGLSVTVLDPQGAPLIGVEVCLYADQHTRITTGEVDLMSIESLVVFAARPVSRARTDFEGRAVFDEVQPGSYELRVLVHQQGYRARNETVLVSEGDSQEVVVRVEHALSIAGRVRDLSGAPCAWVIVTARRMDASDYGLVHRAKTGADGSFRLQGLSDGEFLIEVESKLFSPIRVPCRAPSESLELQLKLRTDPSDSGMHMGEIHGTFVGDPPDMVQVRRLGRAGRIARESGTQLVDGDDFHLTGLVDGVYEVRVREVDDEGWTVAQKVVIRDAAVLSGVELRSDI